MPRLAQRRWASATIASTEASVPGVPARSCGRPVSWASSFVQFVQRLELGVADGEIDAREHHQPRQREDEVEGQRDHAREVVQVERAALHVLGRTEGEQLAEDLAVHHHTAHQRDQHHQRREADDPGAEVQPVDVQAVVQRVEEVAADLQAVFRQRLAGARVDGGVAPDRVFGVLGVGQDEARIDAQHRVAVRGVGQPLLGLEARRHRAVHARARLLDVGGGGLRLLNSGSST